MKMPLKDYFKRNFLSNAFSGLASKLADQLMNPGIVIPYLFSSISVPVFASGFIVPLRRAGSTVPQIALANTVKKYPVRKIIWVVAAIGQAISVLFMALFALFIGGIIGGILVLIFLLSFSLIRGFGSISFNDTLAKTISKGQRGKLMASRATLGGLAALGIGLMLRFYVSNTSNQIYIYLLFGAAFFWGIAALLFWMIAEEKGSTETSENTWKDVKKGMKFLKQNDTFRKFIIALSFLTTVVLSVPYFTLLINSLSNSSFQTFGVIFIASSIAQIISNPIWGYFADKSSRKTIIFSGFIAAIMSFVAFFMSFYSTIRLNDFMYGIIMFIIVVALAGVQVGRKTYLVDWAPSEQRALYVATSNTIRGIITIIGILFGVLAQFGGFLLLFSVFTVLMILGVLFVFRLPEIQKNPLN